MADFVYLTLPPQGLSQYKIGVAATLLFSRIYYLQQKPQADGSSAGRGYVEITNAQLCAELHYSAGVIRRAKNTLIKRGLLVELRGTMPSGRPFCFLMAIADAKTAEATVRQTFSATDAAKALELLHKAAQLRGEASEEAKPAAPFHDHQVTLDEAMQFLWNATAEHAKNSQSVKNEQGIEQPLGSSEKSLGKVAESTEKSLGKAAETAPENGKNDVQIGSLFDPKTNEKVQIGSQNDPESETHDTNRIAKFHKPDRKTIQKVHFSLNYYNYYSKYINAARRIFREKGKNENGGTAQEILAPLPHIADSQNVFACDAVYDAGLTGRDLFLRIMPALAYARAPDDYQAELEAIFAASAADYQAALGSDLYADLQALLEAEYA